MVKEVTCLRDPSTSNLKIVSLKELVDEASIEKKRIALCTVISTWMHTSAPK
jgi:hypothetical protein